MPAEWVRHFCLSLPHTTEVVQWGNDLVFKVANKMYAVLALDPAKVILSFKCTDEEFIDLTERDGIIPAPYLARAKWIGLERIDALSRKEIERLLRQSYDLVVAKLPKRLKPDTGTRGGSGSGTIGAGLVSIPE